MIVTELTGLNVGCGAFYAKGWVNTDVTHSDTIHPDVLVTPDNPLPFEPGYFERVYLGHVLEHIPWDGVVDFLHLVAKVMVPGGELGIVGPDIYRSIRQWAEGAQPWEHLPETLEDDAQFQDPTTDRFGARHCWNAYEARVLRLLAHAGFTDIEPIDITEMVNGGRWPVVSGATFQMAATARTPR